MVYVPKLWRRLELTLSQFLRRRNGESRASRTASAIVATGREAEMIDLHQVKVTPRDRQVLNLLVQGCSNKEIAGQLNISPRTVKQHLRTLFLRAGIREGRKRVKLAIALFGQEERQS
jgi:DNA-binding NarL/FixJ family response regulator